MTAEPHAPRRSRWLPWTLGGFALLALVAFLLWRTSGGKDAASEAGRDKPAATQRTATIDGVSVVKLDGGTQRRSGIATESIAAASGSEPVRAFAAVLDSARLTDLTNSAVGAQVQVSAAAAKVAASRAAFTRAQTLYRDAQNVSLAVEQAAAATYAADRGSLAAAQAQAATFGATARQEFGPALGELRSGLVADLIQRRRVLIQITAPPDTAIARPPPIVTVQTDAGHRTAARFVSPAARTDPRIQGMSFYYVAPATSGLLPGMNLLALLPTGAALNGAAVPQAAVVYWQGQAWVYVRRGADTFQRIAVATDTPASGGGYIVRGLAPGAQLVTRGTQLLLSEELRPEVQSSGGDGDGGGD
jgi:hypothetical protein